MVNNTIGILYNIIWKDRVEDPFAIMLAVILMIVDNYSGFTSIVVKDIHVMLVMPIEA